MHKWAYLVIVAVLLAASGLMHLGSTPVTRESAASKAPLIPTVMGEWEGKIIPVDERTIQILETDDVALVEYHRGSEPSIQLALVSGFGNRAAYHPPELCYVGSHYEILDRGKITVDLDGAKQPVMRLRVGRDEAMTEVWYWFTANDRVTHNYYQQQLWLVMDAIRRRPTSGTLMRISTPVDTEKDARKRLESFIQELGYS